MEDISCTAKGAGQGDSGAVADAAIILAESSTVKDANTGGGDGGSASAASLPTTSCSEFHSARIASMLSSRSEFETELEYRTAYSTVHWSELNHHDGASGSGDESGVDHRQYFEELQRDAIWGGFCNQVSDVVLGREVGRGAQGIIYEAQVTFATERGDETIREFETGLGFVVKVMKSGYALEDLQRQWPGGLAALNDSGFARSMFPLYGALVKDHATGRDQFGFVMPKRWGDLRRLIDLRMERNNGEGPPFSTEQAGVYSLVIATQMMHLHEVGIIHRDLKAANVLVSASHYPGYDPALVFPRVDDFECSVGVVGTAFWRAPEILQQLKNGTPGSQIVFTKEMDVYSFGMTCYEIVTGKLPFEEGLPFNEMRDAILDGARPKLPHDLGPFIKGIIISCWHSNPSDRPNFSLLASFLKILNDDWL